jgi:hypothetical protein
VGGEDKTHLLRKRLKNRHMYRWRGGERARERRRNRGKDGVNRWRDTFKCFSPWQEIVGLKG